MSNKFTVIESTDEDKSKEKDHLNKVIKINEIWKRQYYDSLLKAIEKNYGRKLADYPQDDLMKIALAGIKYAHSLSNVRRESDILGIENQQFLVESQMKCQLIDGILTICGYLTLRNFVNTFPIEKKFHGKKWDCKDYFYTMDVLSKMDWDKAIGKEEVSELLWDYMNKDLREAYIEFIVSMSAIYRAQGGKSIAEKWCDELGIPTYTINKETGIVKDNQTGDIMKSKKVSHLHIVE